MTSHADLPDSGRLSHTDIERSISDLRSQAHALDARIAALTDYISDLPTPEETEPTDNKRNDSRYRANLAAVLEDLQAQITDLEQRLAQLPEPRPWPEHRDLADVGTLDHADIDRYLKPYKANAPVEITGARDNTEEALADLLTAMETLGLITDSTTAS
jgi:cell division protein FtsB